MKTLVCAKRAYTIPSMSKSTIPSRSPSDSIVSYTAGILDGEGSIQINPVKGSSQKYWGLSVQISANGKWFLEELRNDWFGIGSVTYWKAKGAKPGRVSSNWRLYSYQAEWFLRCLINHLRLKKPQAEVALEFRKFVGNGRGSLTQEMKISRYLLAEKMRRLNDLNGKATARGRKLGDVL